MKWINSTERKPDNDAPVFIKYSVYKDVAYYEDGVWYNANDDSVLPDLFITLLWWLDETKD